MCTPAWDSVLSLPSVPYVGPRANADPSQSAGPGQPRPISRLCSSKVQRAAPCRDVTRRRRAPPPDATPRRRCRFPLAWWAWLLRCWRLNAHLGDCGRALCERGTKTGSEFELEPHRAECWGPRSPRHPRLRRREPAACLMETRDPRTVVQRAFAVTLDLSLSPQPRTLKDPASVCGPQHFSPAKMQSVSSAA